MLLVLAGIAGLGFAAAVVALFVHWERTGNEQLVPLVLLGMLVVEATLYNDPNSIPRGLFHPGSGSTQLRLPEIYITLALVARLIARGRPNRIGLPAGLWLAFGAWMAVGAVEGKLYYNSFSQDLYEAKDILYIVGAYALAAGVPIRKYIDSGALLKLGTLCIVCASVLDLMTLAGVSVNTNLPLLPLSSFGVVGAETAALYLAIVAMCFMVRLASGPVRLRHVLALIPIVGSCAVGRSARHAGELRGGRVGGGRGGHRRAAARHRPTLLRHRWSSGPDRSRCRRHRHRRRGGTGGGRPAGAPGSARVERPEPLSRRGEGGIGAGPPRPGQRRRRSSSLSTRSSGGGSASNSSTTKQERGRWRRSRTSHNIVLDILLRLGLIGLALFALALGDSIKGGLRVWWRHTDRVTASLALATVGVVVGLFATGLLEPLLDEYRFATLFGVSLGVLRACVTSMHERPRVPSGPLKVTPSRFAAGAGR